MLNMDSVDILWKITIVTQHRVSFHSPPPPLFIQKENSQNKSKKDTHIPKKTGLKDGNFQWESNDLLIPS